MKIPKKIMIAGIPYQIIMRDSDRDGMSERDLAGLSDTKHCKIFIDTGISKEKQESSFIHELIHVICYHYAIVLEERDVMCFEAGIYQTLKDNDLFSKDGA